MKPIILLGVLGLCLGAFWLQKNKAFFGHLNQGDTDEKTLYSATNAQKVYDLSIFAQFPTNVGQSCEELFGCGPNCTINPLCETSQLCAVNGGTPNCTLVGNTCIKKCEITVLQVVQRGGKRTEKRERKERFRTDGNET